MLLYTLPLPWLPLWVMRYGYKQHLNSKSLIYLMTRKLAPPENAYGTGLSLYGAMDEFKNHLTQHIRFENDVLFLNASNAAEETHHG
ncbi:MAG TPA: hypothetical protein VIR76_10030 [Pusillimonas sp.]